MNKKRKIKLAVGNGLYCSFYTKAKNIKPGTLMRLTKKGFVWPVYRNKDLDVYPLMGTFRSYKADGT